jgi:tripartite-type tricarboxylate transporter receptor subunit TctC
MYQMFGTRSRRARLAWAVGAIATLSLSSACGVLGSPEPESGADPAAAFQGKTMTWVVAYEAGDSQDIAARLIAEYFTKHLPGNPTIEVQNMPGGGGLSALQYVHKANADGLTLLFAGGSPPTEQLLKPFRPDATFVDFDISSFKWIGGTGKESNAVWTNTESGITNVDQLVASTKRVKGAATRPGSNTYMFISLLKEVTGAPIDIVTGYESGSDSALALFRNEVQLQGGTWSTLVNNHQGAPTDVLRPLVVLGKDVPDDAVAAEFKGMSGVPLIEELTTDETKKALIKAAIGTPAGRAAQHRPGHRRGAAGRVRRDRRRPRLRRRSQAAQAQLRAGPGRPGREAHQRLPRHAGADGPAVPEAARRGVNRSYAGRAKARPVASLREDVTNRAG